MVPYLCAATVMLFTGWNLVDPSCTVQYGNYKESRELTSISSKCQSYANQNIICWEKDSSQFYGPNVNNVNCVQLLKEAEERELAREASKQASLADGTYWDGYEYDNYYGDYYNPASDYSDYSSDWGDVGGDWSSGYGI